MPQARVQAALNALAARPRDFRAQVANVKVEPERGIVMRLNGGLDIVLGPPLALRSQAARGGLGAAPLPDEGRSRTASIYADVSAPIRPAVMPRGGYAETAGLGKKPKKTTTERHGREKRSEWRLMRARTWLTRRSCIVRNGLVALAAAPRLRISERG